MRTEDKVRIALESLALEGAIIDLETDTRGRVVAIVTAPAFADMPEEERQSLVWGALLGSLDGDDLSRVEFVFTNAPRRRRTSGGG